MPCTGIGLTCHHALAINPVCFIGLCLFLVSYMMIAYYIVVQKTLSPGLIVFCRFVLLIFNMVPLPQLDKGNVLISVCLSLCLSVCRVTREVMGKFSWNLANRQIIYQRRVELNFEYLRCDPERIGLLYISSCTPLPGVLTEFIPVIPCGGVAFWHPLRSVSWHMWIFLAKCADFFSRNDSEKKRFIL